MPIEIIDVIDTAVKVGLGALISGVTTYKVTHLNHRSDKKKELAKRKSEVILFSIEQLEFYFTAFSKCQSLLVGILLSGVAPGDFPSEKFQNYKKLDDLLVESWGFRLVALSRLQLIGLANVSTLILQTNEIDKRLRSEVVFNKKLQTEEYYKGLAMEMNCVKSAIYKALSESFENVYDSPND